MIDQRLDDGQEQSLEPGPPGARHQHPQGVQRPDDVDLHRLEDHLRPRGRHAVEREDVDVHAEHRIVTSLLDHAGPGVGDLHVGVGPVVRIGQDVHLQVLRLRAAGELGDEALVVGTQHHQVDVVVPRDVAAVPHGTEQRAAAQEVGQATIAAEGVDPVQDLHLTSPHLGAGQRRRIGHRSCANAARTCSGLGTPEARATSRPVASSTRVVGVRMIPSRRTTSRWCSASTSTCPTPGSAAADLLEDPPGGPARGAEGGGELEQRGPLGRARRPTACRRGPTAPPAGPGTPGRSAPSAAPRTRCVPRNRPSTSAR